MPKLRSPWPRLELRPCPHAPGTCPHRTAVHGSHKATDSDATCLGPLDTGSALERLSACVTSDDDMQALRGLLGDAALTLHRLDARRVVSQVAALVETRRLCLLEGRELPRETSARQGLATAVGPADPPPPLRPRGTTAAPPTPAEDPQHWIEIELVGVDDQPVPHVEYLVQTPSGEFIRGRLDGSGYAHIDRLRAPGQCRVSFPGLDRDAWQLATTLPRRA